jgi:hypothetical protein
LATAPRFAQPRQDQLCAEIGPHLGDASRRHSQAKVTTQPGQRPHPEITNRAAASTSNLKITKDRG